MFYFQKQSLNKHLLKTISLTHFQFKFNVFRLNFVTADTSQNSEAIAHGHFNINEHLKL